MTGSCDWHAGICSAERKRHDKNMKSYTLQKKMIRLFSSAFIAISLLTSVIMSVIVGKMNIDTSRRLCEQLVSLNLDSLNNKMIETQRTQEIIASNMIVREAVHYYTNSEEKDYAQKLEYRRAMDDVFYVLTKNSKIKNAYIIDPDGNYIYFYKESLQYDHNMLQEEWYRQTVENISMNTCYVTPLHDRNYMVNDREADCISMIIPIRRKETYLFHADAYLVCDIDLGTVLRTKEQNGNIQFAVYNETDILYTSKPEGLSEEEKAILFSGAGTMTQIFRDTDGMQTLLVMMDARMFGWRVAGMKELSEIRMFNRMLAFLFTGIVSITILLVIGVSQYVARSILKPMNRLIESCNQVGEGKCGHVIEEGSAEIAYLSSTINHMLHNINTLSGKLLEEEKQLADERLRTLQQQINPHFLNNVLQTMKALAIEKETNKISRITTLLGRFLAYSVYQPYQKVTLITELDYLRDYIDLQNIRYGGRIVYSIDCEEEIQDILIPKITLQPVVENSIEHGFRQEKNLVINVSAENDLDSVNIIIRDNGQGMTEEQTAEIKAQIDLGNVYQQECSIGIVNVSERIRRMYGTDYGIEIISQKEKGTTVIIKIPDRRE